VVTTSAIFYHVNSSECWQHPGVPERVSNPVTRLAQLDLTWKSTSRQPRHRK